MNISKIKNKGFTLIELVMVITILAILAAIAVPQFTNLMAPAQTNAEKGVVASVRSALTMYVADQVSQGKTADADIYPSVTNLAAKISPAGTAAATGVQVVINGQTVTVKTFTDATCATATTAVADLVKCVSE